MNFGFFTIRRSPLILITLSFLFCLSESSSGLHTNHPHRHHHLVSKGTNKTMEVVYKRSKQHALKGGLFSLHSHDPLCSNSVLMETLSKKKMGLTFLRRRCSNSLESEKGPTVAHLRSRRKSRAHSRKNKAKQENDYTKIGSLINKTYCQAIKGLHEIENPMPLLETYMPCKVPVKRCAGCCLSELIECVPAKVKYRKFKVLKRKKYQPLSSAVESVAVEEHLKCECKCKIKASDCGPGQIYEEENCLCKCPTGSHTTCPQSKVWNESECKCICRNIKECTTGMIFNHDFCSCEQKQPYYGGVLYDELS